MQIGFLAVGIGVTADPDIIATVAHTAEQAGFHSLWAPEHVVLIKDHQSKYPYAASGQLPFDTRLPILDPWATLAYAAAHTKTLRLGTGICLVPEHNPVVLAKLIASVDVLSHGRVDFGVGIGWLAEEFAAVNVPWERRAERTREYLRAMKLLWTEEEPEFSSAFYQFPKVHMFPKPVQKPYPPIIFGGESTPALKRVGEVGDGWFGLNVTIEDAQAKIPRMKHYAEAAGRNPNKLQFFASPGIGIVPDLDMIKRYRDAGVQQVITGVIAGDPKTMKDDIARLGDTVVRPAANI